MIASLTFPDSLENNELDYYEECSIDTFEQYLEIGLRVSEGYFCKNIPIFDIFKERQVCAHYFDSFHRRDIKPSWIFPFYLWQSHARKKRSTPFGFTFEEYIVLPYNKIKELYSQVIGSHKDTLERAWKKGIRHIVICNNRVVKESDKIEDISDDEIKQLGQENNSACYVFSAPDFVEESTWHSCLELLPPDPPYPTIPIYVGHKDSTEDEIIKDSPPIITDFDTGNASLKCFSSAIINPLIVEGEKIHRHRSHLGHEYWCFLRHIKLCIKDINQKINSKNYDILLVFEWEKDCALLRASPNRLGLIGRDVTHDLGVFLLLDSRNEQTQVLEVG